MTDEYRREYQHRRYARLKAQKPKKKSKPKSPKRLPKLLTNPPEPLTWQSLMQWLSDTGWVEGFIGKKISPLDRMYFEDYVQECWIQILSVPQDKMMGIWYKGKGKMINYIKSLIINNIRSSSSILYKNIRQCHQIERTLDDEQWRQLDNTGESEYDTSFCINDYDPSDRHATVHHGYDKESCKVDDDDRVGEDNLDF